MQPHAARAEDARSPSVPRSPDPADRIGITDQELTLLRQLILREAGIFLAPVKRELLVARLGRRLRELGVRSFGAYYRRVRQDPAELAEMLDRVTTNETRFFREPAQFEFLTDRALPGWEEEARAGRRSRRLRAWSAGCSTGEEPFSVAMCALEHLPGWSVDVLATDLSRRALATARDALWPIARAEQIPERYRERYMLRGVRTREGWMKAGPELRSAVRFARLNLSRELPAEHGRFDLILCRNVLIYFHPTSRARTLRALLDRLAPGGYLLLGHSESPGELLGELRRVVPTVYSRPSLGGAGR
jgi:chemotaxis protein methyltransferase CheR